MKHAASQPPWSGFADHGLVRRVESAWDTLGVHYAHIWKERSPGADDNVLAVGGGHAVFLGSGSPLSQAQGMGLNGPVADDELAQMEQFFKDRETPAQIEVATLADATLLPTLCARGYTILEQTHSLVADLRDWPSSTRKMANEIEISCSETEGLEEWVDVLLQSCFDTPEAAPPALSDGALAMAQIPSVTTWMARIDGKPVGGGLLMIHDGMGLICADGTLPEYRQRGVQSMLLEARLRHARNVGCDMAAICTLPGSGSQRNAERQGFRVTYARTLMIRC